VPPLRAGPARLVDADRAEEVVQEVFLRLWNEPERFDPSGKLRSFLNRQAHSRAVERVRSEELVAGVSSATTARTSTRPTTSRSRRGS
jgi:DNA-directed RNA polymerase specialized sigma24 family protein